VNQLGLAAAAAVFPQAELPLELKRGALAILERAWPTGRSIESRLSKPLHDPRTDPVCMLLIVSSEVVSYLAILSKEIDHAGSRYRAAGLSAVSTHPDHLRHGYAGQLVTAAREHIAAMGADIGIFTCDPPLAPFYVSHGWDVMPSTVVVGGTKDRPLRADAFEKTTLMRFFTQRAATHRSDFDNADVYLVLREGDLW
jgi:aminoglycoside 2'-N-acetyltransferase I